MTDPYYLKVMGAPRLFRPDGRLVKLKVRKHLALLIYFTLEGRSTYRRDELVELLWPAAKAKGRQSLSMAFSVLRSLFGPDCVRGQHAIAQFSGPPLLLDLHQLERGQVLGSEIAPPLEVDGLLRDFEIEDAPAFQHWRDGKRAEFFPAIKAGILKFIDQARRSGDIAAMKSFADRLLAVDHLAEEGIATRMEALAMQGDRLGALRIFESWKRELLDDLGARPSEELEALATRLRRRSRPTLSTHPAASSALEQQSERPFVGRSAEYRLLFEAWESTLQGQSSHVLISGESGIGKSTLAMRFGEAASLAGATVARVQCFELEQRIAFGMIGALVTSLLDRPGVVGTSPESLAEVARIVPRVGERFPNLPSPRPIEGEAARLHFAEGTFALFDAIMEEQPLVLIVDDYPRSDEASLSVLHMLLRRSGNNRLMVVLAGRPPEPDEPAQAVRIRKAVSYLPLRHVALRPLTEGESEEVVRAILKSKGKETGSPERRAIIRTAAGNPMVLELLTQDWLAHPDTPLAVVLTAMNVDVPGAALESLECDQLIDRLLPELTPRNRLALYLAAILGPRLNDLDYFRILDLSPSRTMLALSEMVQGRVLRNTPHGLEFTNEVIRARLYVKIPAASRVRLHRGVADRLLAATTRGESIPDMEIAWHSIRAGRAQAAIPHLMRAARDAITHGAPDEAARALTTGIINLRGRAKAEAALLLAETHREMGHWHEALECLRPYTDEYEHDEGLCHSASILVSESKYQLGHYSAQEQQTLIPDLIKTARTAHDLSTRIRAARLILRLADGPHHSHSVSAATHAIASIPHDDLSEQDAAKVLLARALADYHFGNHASGLERVHVATDLLKHSGVTDTEFIEAHRGQGAFACANGAYEDAIPPVKLAFGAASRLDNSSLMASAANTLALCYHRLGSNEELLRWAIIARREAQSTRQGSYTRVCAERFCFFGYLLTGHRTKALEALRRLVEIREDVQETWSRQLALTTEADASWLMENKHAGFRIAEEMLNSTPRTTHFGLAGSTARWITLLSLNRRKPQDASEFLWKSYERLDRLDTLDQAEVLCSLSLLRQHGMQIPGDVGDRTRIVMAKLPVTCSLQIRELGLPIPE